MIAFKNLQRTEMVTIRYLGKVKYNEQNFNADRIDKTLLQRKE